MWKGKCKKHWRSTLADIFRPTFNHLSLPKDLWIFPIHFSTVGFKDSLSVQLKPKYLNSLTKLIFSPFIFTFTTGLLLGYEISVRQFSLHLSVVSTFLNMHTLGYRFAYLLPPNIGSSELYSS